MLSALIRRWQKAPLLPLMHQYIAGIVLVAAALLKSHSLFSNVDKSHTAFHVPTWLIYASVLLELLLGIWLLTERQLNRRLSIVAISLFTLFTSFSYYQLRAGIELLADTVDTFVTSPASLTFHNDAAVDRMQTTITLYESAFERIEVTKIATPNGEPVPIEWSVVTSSASAGRRHSMTLSLNQAKVTPNEPAGFIRIHTTSELRPYVDVPFRLLGSDVVGRPRLLGFGVVRMSDRVTRTSRILIPDDASIEQVVSTSTCFTAKLRGNRENKEREVDVDFAPDKAGIHNCQVTIRIGSANEVKEIVLNCSALVVPD